MYVSCSTGLRDTEPASRTRSQGSGVASTTSCSSRVHAEHVGQPSRLRRAGESDAVADSALRIDVDEQRLATTSCQRAGDD